METILDWVPPPIRFEGADVMVYAKILDDRMASAQRALDLWGHYGILWDPPHYGRVAVISGFTDLYLGELTVYSVYGKCE